MIEKFVKKLILQIPQIKHLVQENNALKQEGKQAKKFCFAKYFILALFGLLIVLGLATIPLRTGDGHEYALILQAFFDHFSPDIRLIDIETLRSLIKKFQSIGYSDNLLLVTYQQMQQDKLEVGQGIFRSNQDQYFGYHFWFYSLINLPMKFVLSLLKINELKVFQLTNALLIIGVVSYILLDKKQSKFTRWTITILYLLGGVFLYVQWSYPELFTASMLMIASYSFLNSNYQVSVFSAALASLQNPSILFFIFLIFLAKILSRSQKLLIDSLKLLILSSIALIPYGFYWFHFGKINLIQSKGFINYSLIGLERLSSALFDINQGMIIGFPGVMLGLIVLMVIRGIKIFYRPQQSLFNRDDLLLIAPLVMILPTLGQMNWNSGSAVVSRYAFWAGIPMITWVAFNLQILNKTKRLILLIIMIVFQIFPHWLYVDAIAKYGQGELGYVHLNILAHSILEKSPKWYNLDPEIFAERTKGTEEIDLNNTVYFYKDSAGQIKKILVFSSTANSLEFKLCGLQSNLINSDTNTS